VPGRSFNPLVKSELDRIDARPPGMKSVLYRRHDAEGALLYVGVSDWPYDRAVGHGTHSLWVQFAVAGTNTWYPSRAEAEKAEKLAIATELPLFNRYHSVPGARERLVDYLVARDRHDLLDSIKDWKWDYRGPRRRVGLDQSDQQK
jgi:hypothetical protein